MPRKYMSPFYLQWEPGRNIGISFGCDFALLSHAFDYYETRGTLFDSRREYPPAFCLPSFCLKQCNKDAQLEADKTDPTPLLVEQPIDHVLHSEPAEHINELEAGLIVAEQEAGFIERRIESLGVVGIDSPEAVTDDDASSTHIDIEKVHIVKLSRNPKELRGAFCEGRPLQSCRSALESHGHPWKLVTGTLVFVHPKIYREVMRALNGMKLQPSNIVFSEAFESVVDEALSLVLLGST